jgi:curved DNA-binding protein CbpA
MVNEPDHYQILGLVPNVEPEVIRAAYRALVAIYHPDRNRDVQASEKIRQINSAYEVISDTQKRKEYDTYRADRARNATSVDFENERPFTTSPIDKAWSVATEFYNYIDAEARDLEKISWRLSFAYKLKLLEGKHYEDSPKIARKLKAEYLSRYFGKHKDVQAYAEQLIKAGRKDAALYLNEIVNVMGSSVRAFQIQKKIEDRFGDIKQILTARQIYSQLISHGSSTNVTLATRLVELHGGKVKSRFFNSRMDVMLDGDTISFEDSDKFCLFVLERYSGYA